MRWIIIRVVYFLLHCRDVVIKLDRSQPSFGISPLDTVATCAAPVAPKRTRISQSKHFATRTSVKIIGTSIGWYSCLEIYAHWTGPSRHTLHHQLQFNGFNSSSLPFGEQDETADAKGMRCLTKSPHLQLYYTHINTNNLLLFNFIYYASFVILYIMRYACDIHQTCE